MYFVELSRQAMKDRKHRLVYDVVDNSENILSPDGTPYDGIVRVKRMWTHYE